MCGVKRTHKKTPRKVVKKSPVRKVKKTTTCKRRK